MARTTRGKPSRPTSKSPAPASIEGKPSPGTAHPTHDEIAALAHRIWLERGGNDVVNWLEAESRLLRTATRST